MTAFLRPRARLEENAPRTHLNRTSFCSNGIGFERKPNEMKNDPRIIYSICEKLRNTPIHSIDTSRCEMADLTEAHHLRLGS